MLTIAINQLLKKLSNLKKEFFVFSSLELLNQLIKKSNKK